MCPLFFILLDKYFQTWYSSFLVVFIRKISSVETAIAMLSYCKLETYYKHRISSLEELLLL